MGLAAKTPIDIMTQMHAAGASLNDALTRTILPAPAGTSSHLGTRDRQPSSPRESSPKSATTRHDSRPR